MSRKKEQPDIEPSGFFAFRTPLLPFEEIEAWSAGLEAAGVRDDPAALEEALAADRTRLRERLQSLLERPEIREALFVASPTLDEGLEYWRKDPDSKKGRRAEEALVRYVQRMATRATPFGLFSGCSVGTLDGENRLELTARDAYQRHTRLDMDYLFALTEELGNHPELRRQLRYWPNSSLYLAAGRWRYAEARLQDKVRSHHLVAVETAGYLERTLDRARQGATIGELARALVEDDPEIELEEAEEFIGELIDSQLLVSRLSINVSGEEPIYGVIGLLGEHPEIAPITAELQRVRRALDRIDEAGLGNDPAAYRRVAERLEELPAKVDLPRLFQVDMVKPVERASLGQDVLDEIERGISMLRLLAGSAQRETPLRRFCQDFMERYEDAREVPLAEVLDEEVGIGFDRSRGAEASPLLDGIYLPSPEGEQRVAWGPYTNLLLRKLEQALAEGLDEIEVTDKDLVDFEADDLPPLADAFQVMGTLAAESQQALDGGEFRFWLRHASGPSGARLLGRFCHADPELEKHVRAHLEAEEALDPDAVYAEIVHLPEGRMGNILSRPVLRRYEIPYLGLSGAPEEHQIPIEDLTVTVSGGQQVILRSKRLGKRVIPRLTSAHNFSARSLGVYRFLCTLQGQGVREGVGWSWGPFEQARFLPRVRYGRLVLERARWRVSEKEIERLSKKKGDTARFQAVQRWRHERDLPSRVLLVDSDNELLVDFDNVLSVESFLALIKRRPQLQLAEFFPGPDALCARGPEGRFVQEVVIPYVCRREPRAGRLPALSAPLRRSFGPGSEWLYAKLYTGTSTADQILRQVVGPLSRRALAEGWVDHWFFIRYGDPHWHLRWRLHGDPESLSREVLPLIERSLAPLFEDGRLWRLQLDTYDRELERYGGAHGMEPGERLFWVDSEAVLEIVDAIEGDEGADARWRLAFLGTDLLLRDLGFDEPTKLEVLQRMQQSFAREFRTGPPLKKQLADRLRKERAALEILLADERSPDHPLAPGFEILERRSERLRPIVEELRRLEAAGKLTMPLTELAPSYVHMFNNRLLRAEGRAHEMVLYDFLFQLNRSLIARRRQQQKRTSKKTQKKD